MTYTFNVPATLAFDVVASSREEACKKAALLVVSGYDADQLLGLTAVYVKVADDAEVELVDSFLQAFEVEEQEYGLEKDDET
jgi:hypothetical protein